MFISYAQNFEDVMLWRALKHVKRGFYIDIGAQDPVIDSVSRAFYEHGWRGVHVEPTPHYAGKLRQDRPDETVLQAALGSQNRTLNFFEVINTGLSTGDEKIAEKHRDAGFAVREQVVPCLPLADLLELYQDQDIHWLKIDVEGMEKQVLEGWGVSEIRPWIVVVESTLPNTQIETYQQWEHLLTELGYQFVYFDGLSRFYISKAHQELKDYFRCPPNVFDNFALSGTSGGYSVLLNNKLSQCEQELTTQLEHSREKTQRLMDDLTERDRVLAALQAQVERLNNERNVVAERNGEIAALQSHVQHLLDNLANRDREIGVLQVQAEGLNNDWNVAKVKIDELNNQTHHWWTVADGLNQELRSVYASRSWKMTKPLRWINWQCKKFFGGLKFILAYVAGVPRRVARRLLETVLTHVRRHPQSKAWLKGFLRRWPRLQARLYSFALARLATSAVGNMHSTSATSEGSPDLSNYGESVRNVYLQLVKARSRADQARNKEGQL